jgi:TatD DNase family protein
MQLLDSHAHLQHGQFHKDRNRVIERALASGVSEIVNVGYDMESSRMGIELAEKFEFMYAAVGIHPHDSRDLDESALKELEQMSDHPKVVAMGEMGLDYYRDLSPREDQKKAFIRQLELAKSVNLPVVIHVRDAHADAVQILKDWGRGDGVMHCFSGSLEEAKVFLGLGFKLGFTGSITFGSPRLESVVKSAGQDAILIETDCPYLTPRPNKGRNEPAYLVMVCEKVAAVLGKSPGEAAAITSTNAKSLYRI